MLICIGFFVAKRVTVKSCMRKLNLLHLILLLTVSTAVLILGNTFYTSYQTQRALLIEQTLEANQAYASKLATNIEGFIVSAQQQLSFAARDVLLTDRSAQPLDHIVERLIKQTDSFNSVVIADAAGTIVAASETAKNLLNIKPRSAGSLQALEERKPLISKPFHAVGTVNRTLIFITHPIFDDQENYLGFIGGSIYLQQKSVLYALLGEHFHKKGSTVYAVNQEARLIYHPDAYRVGELVDDSVVVNKVLANHVGSEQVVNTRGVEVLAGYAYVPSAGWGVVTQRTLNATLAGMDKQMLAVAQYSFPFFILILLVVWRVSRWISMPLSQLAHSAEDLGQPGVDKIIANVPAWYFEAAQLKRAILRGLAGVNKKIGRLNLESITDPLTGLINRRGMQAVLDEWQQLQQSFSVITGDIDHFKRINDEFGHAVGDEVLKYLAKHMQASSRADDLVCRTGGEEFIILLPKTDVSIAYKAAKRLGEQVSRQDYPGIGRPITLSFGVASWPCGNLSIAEVLKNADRALYAAKQAGRNQVQSGQKCLKTRHY